MSRIVVKNLPVNEYIGKDELREIFSQKGEVTHVRLLHNRTGRFAFIEFRQELEAQKAIEYFNGCYINKCRITCEVPTGLELKPPKYTTIFVANAMSYPIPSNPPTIKTVFDPYEIVVSDLPVPLTAIMKDLVEYFSWFGTITEVHPISDNHSFHGIAFIRFSSPESASRAIEVANNSYFKGTHMPMRVLPVVQDSSSNEEENNVSTDKDSKTLAQPIEEESKVAEGTFVYTVTKQVIIE